MPLEEKRTKTIEGKRPWEEGFEGEEAEQKATRREQVGDDPQAIRDSSLYQKTDKGEG